MPILITGLSNNSPNDKKKQKRDKAGKLLAQSSSEDLLPASQREDRGEDTSQGYLCSMDGIAEIFNMRMYKIPREAPTGRLEKGTTHSGALMKPHVIKTKTILIGASYHVEEDTQTGRRSVRKEALRKPSKPAASEEEAKKLSALALRLQQLKNRGVTDQVHEKLKQRIRESQARSWMICHGKDLIEGGRRAKDQVTPRTVDDVIRRALMYVEEHEGHLVQELFHLESELRLYIHGLKRAMRRKKIRLRLSESRQKIIQEHLFFGDKNIKPESQAPVDGGLLHLANKPRKKPIKLKSANVVAYLSGTMSGGGAGGERRLPLVDRLNKVQADMTAALHAIAFPPPDKKKKNSVSFRNGLSAQSSNSSMDTFSPRPPGEPDGADDGSRRHMSHRKLVARESPSLSRKGSNASISSVGRTSIVDVEAGSSIDELFVSAPGDSDGVTIHSTEGEELVAHRGRAVSMESVSSDSPEGGDMESPPRVPSDGSSNSRNISFRGRNRTSSISNSNSGSNNKPPAFKPTPPVRPPPKRPKSEQLRARKLAMPARYENSDSSDSVIRPVKLSGNDIKLANKIAESQMVLIKKQYIDRHRQITELARKAATAAARADESGDNFVSSWEKQSENVHRTNKVFQFGLDCKETDWSEDIKIKYDCFVTDGTDDGYGKLGVNFQVDMASMRHRLKDKNFEIKCENLLRHKWFVTIVVKLKEKIETVFTPIPMSCFKFLLAVKEMLVLGQDLTIPVFFSLVAATVAPEDHKDVFIHRTLKSVRDSLKIHPDTFLEYLEKEEIQPCPELLSQVRSHRKKIVNQSKLAGLAKTINTGKATMLASKPRRWGNTGAIANSAPESEANTPSISSPEHSRAPTAQQQAVGPQTDLVTTVVLSKLEKSVTFSMEDTVHMRRQTLNQKKAAFDNIAEMATEQWRQKHALLMRHDIASIDDRNSNMFASPDNSFEMFGDGTMSSLDDIGSELGGFISMDYMEEEDENEEEND